MTSTSGETRHIPGRLVSGMVRQSPRAATRNSSMATSSLLHQEAVRPRRKPGMAPDTIARREGLRGIPLTSSWLEANPPKPHDPFPKICDGDMADNPTPPSNVVPLEMSQKVPVVQSAKGQCSMTGRANNTQVAAPKLDQNAPTWPTRTFSILQLVVRSPYESFSFLAHRNSI